MIFTYENFVKRLLLQGKRRESWFATKFYIERKTRKQIVEEMYMNSLGYYYNLKSKVKELLDEYFIIINGDNDASRSSQ